MVRELSLIAFALLFVSASYGADHRALRITRQESKEIASKATKIIINEEHPILERTLERSIIKPPCYSSADLQGQRQQTIDKLTREEIHDPDALKEELMQWAIKELAERNAHEVEQKNGEQKKKWVAATIGLITTIISVAVPIIFSEDCGDCPSDG